MNKEQLRSRNERLRKEIEALKEKQKCFLNEEYDAITKTIVEKLDEKNIIMNKLLKDIDPNILPKDLFKNKPAVQGPLTPQEYKIKQRLTRVKPVLYFKKG